MKKEYIIYKLSDASKEACKIDTFETSILPYEDCCTVFTPKHPRTKPQLKFVKYAEEQMDSEQLIQRAIDGIELLSISNS